MKVLVLNAGSSSLKYRLFVDEKQVAYGAVERIGESESGIKNHMEALKVVGKRLRSSGVVGSFDSLDAVGHRVVHGGEKFTDPVLVDEKVIEALRELIPLAPLHNPANIEGILTMRKIAPDVPQVAVFDTAFHQSMPKEAFLYAIPLELYSSYGIRRYGFHGTSHSYIFAEAAKLLGRPRESLNVITLHLGNGASACAIENGRSIDTSMGFTPLEGLVMGTRCGDLDPEIPLFLEEKGVDAGKILNKESGLKGLCGYNDMREVEKSAADKSAEAQTALKIYSRRVRKYIGAYFALLGRVDAVVFTAGIGENSPKIREMVCSGLENLGIELDMAKNRAGETDISKDTSRSRIFVIKTDEELQIARETEALLSDGRL
ncbi:acetate kinase [Hydrogenimonas sp.]|nr:acetate kinase [Hydrogenimonas sp.]